MHNLLLPLLAALTLATTASVTSVAQDREREKLMEQRLRRLATEQLDRALAEVAGSSPVTAAKRVAAAWDADRERCDASAKSREEKYACADMVIYGNAVAGDWLDHHQKDEETIYGVQQCIHKPPAGMTPCDDRVFALPPAAQSEAGCRKFAIENWELDGPLDGVNDHYCKARAARGKPWVTVFSKTRQ